MSNNKNLNYGEKLKIQKNIVRVAQKTLHII